MTLINPAKLLFDSANEHAKKLQKEMGKPERGIVSTQVQGLIIALGMTQEYILSLITNKFKKIKKVDPEAKPGELAAKINEIIDKLNK